MRDLAEKIAFSYLGRPYIWGGDDPSGFDCSGFIIEIFKSIGKLPRKGDWTASQLSQMWQRIGEPHKGDLVFWENRNHHVIHVEMCLGDGLSIGASGGGSKTLTVADAMAHNAFIKIRPIKTRLGVWGYNNPFLLGY
mgnify:CR=1 FL=1